MPVNLTVKKFSRGVSVLKEAEDSQPPKEPKKRGRPPKNKEIFVKEELKPIQEEESEFQIDSDSDSDSNTSSSSFPNVNLENAFLNDLNKTNYKEEVEEEIKKEVVEPKPKVGGLTQAEDIMNNLFEETKQIAKRKPKQTKQGYDHDIYSDNPTPLLGKDKRILLSKLNQYKLLFPDELRNLKLNQIVVLTTYKMH